MKTILELNNQFPYEQCLSQPTLPQCVLLEVVGLFPLSLWKLKPMWILYLTCSFWVSLLLQDCCNELLPLAIIFSAWPPPTFLHQCPGAPEHTANNASFQNLPCFPGLQSPTSLTLFSQRTLPHTIHPTSKPEQEHQQELYISYESCPTHALYSFFFFFFFPQGPCSIPWNYSGVIFNVKCICH